ncbi:MAG: KH domain-containing protein [Deltaproteobacteria bacterium]|jgi:hypothetical protein|nr:KH domain-containing protein [Deltaproteobacteria bacterium]
MEALLEQLGRGLVAHPEEFKVEKKTDGDIDQYLLNVHPDDFGQVIGRQGRTARALRAVVKAAAARSGRRASVEILE